MAVLLGCALLGLHWAACTYMMLWPDQPADLWTAYNTALYYCITTLTTVGYGDITPKDNVSRLFAMSLMGLGAACYGLIISHISNFLVKRDARKEEIKNKVESLESLFKHYEIPAALKSQAMGYYHHVLQRQANDSEHKILESFPKQLRAEIQVYMNIKPLSHVSLFKGCSVACLADAAHRLEQVFVTPGEVIVRAGDIGDEMYVIGWGRVMVHVGDKHVTDLKDGSCFGEMALINDEKRGASVTALTYCDLFKLERTRFQELLVAHADLRANVEALVAARAAPKKSAA